jgi:hypothetical protein
VITIIVVLTLLTQPLTATWERPGVARVSWHGAGCLFHNRTLYRCYDGGRTLLIGGAQTDGAYRPRVGSIYTLQRPDGTIEQAQLRGVVYVAVWRR